MEAKNDNHRCDIDNSLYSNLIIFKKEDVFYCFTKPEITDMINAADEMRMPLTEDINIFTDLDLVNETTFILKLKDGFVNLYESFPIRRYLLMDRINASDDVLLNQQADIDRENIERDLRRQQTLANASRMLREISPDDGEQKTQPENDITFKRRFRGNQD